MEQYTPTYWNNRGKYQKLYDDLYDTLVPEMGAADTQAGELLRQVSRVYYDLYNNGWGNGPWSSAADLLRQYESPIKASMKDSSNFDVFWQAFDRTNYGGDYTRGLTTEEEMAFDDVVNGVVRVVANLAKVPSLRGASADEDWTAMRKLSTMADLEAFAKSGWKDLETMLSDLGADPDEMLGSWYEDFDSPAFDPTRKKGWTMVPSANYLSIVHNRVFIEEHDDVELYVNNKNPNVGMLRAEEAEMIFT